MLESTDSFESSEMIPWLRFVSHSLNLRRQINRRKTCNTIPKTCIRLLSLRVWVVTTTGYHHDRRVNTKTAERFCRLS
jgi:hypothetical protein